MTRFLTLALVTGLATVGLAQKPSEARVNAIWNAASERMSQQIDIWFDAGEFPMIVQLLRFENDLYPNDGEVASNLGWMLENTEKWDEAVATYERYRKLNPKDPDANYLLGQYYFLKRNFGKVVDVLEPSISSDRAHPNIFRMLANSYEKVGKLQDSKRVWERYLSLAPNDETAKHNLARVESKMQKTQPTGR